MQTEAAFSGGVDVVFRGRVQGWVWNQADPRERLTVIVRDAKSILAEIEASQLRPDLAASGVGDGRYGFSEQVGFEGEPEDITVEIKGAGFELPVAPRAYAPHWLNPDDLPDTQINIFNFKKLRDMPPSRHFYVRLDTNFECNLHCVYCHNPRSAELIAIDDLRDFLHDHVVGVENFQIGCAMEPTLDERLTEFMLMVAASPARPRNIFQLQTNGTLLHRHDFSHMKAAGLTSLSVSLDSADPETQKSLRSGTSLKKVLRNVAEFRDACPEIDVQFITTTTSANVGRLGDIIRLGTELGVSNFAFREIFYISNNKVVDHTRMPGLLLKPGEFADAQQRLRDEFPDVAMGFFDTEALDDAEQKIKSDSFL